MSTWGIATNNTMPQTLCLMARVCSKCGSETTQIRKDRYHEGYQRWRFDDNGNVLCTKCYTHYVLNPKRVETGYWKQFHHRQTYYKGKARAHKQNPRTGICSVCGKTGKYQTHMHHEQYDDNDILKYTVELCGSCHAKITLHDRRLW